MRIGIDNYGLFPLRLSLLEVLEWAQAHGAEGVHYSGLNEGQGDPDDAMLRELAHAAREKGLYVEWGGGQHIPYDTLTWKAKDVFEVNRKAAGQARILGANIVRSCSGGLFRMERDSPVVEEILRETADALRAQKTMLEDHGVTLAVETHFEFTSFELLRLMDLCGADPGGWLGICLDTMNLLVLLEDPLMAVDRLLPWIVSTHIKDGGILLGEDGLTVFPIEIGRGIVDFQSIVGRIQTLDRPVNLSVEDHGGSFGLHIFDPDFLGLFPDLGVNELSRLVQMAYQSRRMHALGLKDITTRPLWPSVCEDRISGNLKAIKEIVTR